MPSVETARLRLRMFTLDDLSEHHRLIFGDPDVMRTVSTGQPLSIERTEVAIRRFIKHWQDNGFGLWAVEHKEGGNLIGHCGMQHLENSPEIELVYALAKPYWGQGLATEAARAALRFGLDEIKLDRIVAIAMPKNTTSQNVMRKLGLQFERDTTFYQLHVVLYAIARENYRPDNAEYHLHV